MIKKINILSFLLLMNATLFAADIRIDFTSKLGLSSGSQFAQLFVPDYYEPPADGKFMLVFHFHSATWAAEDEITKSGMNAVLFNIHLGALSSPYQNYFQDQSKFKSILDEILDVLQNNTIIRNPTIETLILTSFSAGYAGVREILKVENYYQQIDALNLADGLHSSSYHASRDRQMQDFVRFAKDVRDGKKIMLITHSSIPTSGYKSTTETADYLIQKIGATKTPASVQDEIGLQTSACDTGHFHLRGYAGETAEDHLKHLYAMHLLLTQAMGILQPTSVGRLNQSAEQPDAFGLANYPNPFNATTNISWRQPRYSSIQITIYDINGQLVETLCDEQIEAGRHFLTWNAQPYHSELYTLILKADDYTESRKCLLLK